MERFYTCEQVAERYGVKVITIWEWIRKRKLPAIKIGGQYRVTENDLKNYEREHRTVYEQG